MKKLCLVLMLFSTRAFAVTYYIDFSSGSDTNDGTSKTTPWKHAPGMAGATGNVLRIDPEAGVFGTAQPGDRFILKGGVKWPAAALGWTWRSSGAPGNNIYIGVDKTWFAGAFWTQPNIDGEGRFGNTAAFLQFAPVSRVTVDNIEFTGLFWSNSASNAFTSMAYISMGTSTDIEIMNCYFHGWTHAPYQAGVNGDAGHGILGDTSASNKGSSVHDCVIDGTDTDQKSLAAGFGGPPTWYNNAMRNVANGLILNYDVSIHDNLIENINTSFDPTQHTNGYESNINLGVLVYNNVIRHLGPGTLGIWTATQANQTSYIFNNGLYDTQDANILVVALPLQYGACVPDKSIFCPGGNVVIYNNTIECGLDSNPNGTCLGCQDGSFSSRGYAYQSCIFKNNHLITNNATAIGGLSYSGTTATNNTVQTKTAANTQGYTLANGFSSTALKNATLGAGLNLSDSCGILTALCKDTTFGNTRTSNQRPATGAWDIGAFQFSVGPSKPIPPATPSVTSVK